ncbi:Lipoate-protein ligase A [Phaffia rhodozyma]|uniref:Putative lipoate-protein ligase A n=1 Tax=Phaffia rhodozyma TaxID=264483 RepID=A0A0F7SLK8_PHARH|nr:Lipoate-protein ligase A [Phaffia rhodozyma]
MFSVSLRRSQAISCYRRSLSSTTPKPFQLPDDQQIFVSRSNDPWFNLAFENWLFTKTNPAIPILFLYRNKACVVLGRNQNPWKEINLPLLKELEIPFIRRKSGGGTVYHDMGNTNYSILIPKDSFDRRPNAELVARALNTLNVDARLNNRRAYHHGTMLLDAQLGRLGKSLKSDRSFTMNKATDSVPSPVSNISSKHPNVNNETFIGAVVKEFTSVYGAQTEVIDVDEQYIDREGGQMKELVEKEVAELKTWNWAFGQTPEFSIDVQSPILNTLGHSLNASVTSRKGLITKIDLSFPSSPSPLYPSAKSESSPGSRTDLEKLASSLIGRRFGDLDINSEGKRQELENKGVEREVIEWLGRSM